jgi:hypothetical protein
LELDGIDGTIRTICIAFYHLQNSGPPEALEYFRSVVLLSLLGKIESVTKELPHRNWERHQVFFAASDPMELSSRCVHHMIIPEMV